MQVVTDMGFDTLSTGDAVRFFSIEDIQRWWKETISPDEWEREPDYERLFKSLGVEIDLSDTKSVEAFIDEYDWTPQAVDVVTAKAVYGAAKWVQIVRLAYPLRSSSEISDAEKQSILLGVCLRSTLGLDVEIINDNRGVVQSLRSTIPKLVWKGRNCTKAAHNLTIAKATKIVAPGTSPLTSPNQRT